MKANLIVHCAKCGETDVTITRKPNEESYKVYCTACDTLLADIPTYGITFKDEEKEDDHANPTE